MIIPTTRKIGKAQASAYAKAVADGLMANWGLLNAKAIAAELKRVLKKEAESRKVREKHGI